MAGLSTDIWEFRPAQNKPNSGGGFDTASGGTDYSNQDSAQLQLTDLATSGIGVTTLTSVTGGFTSAMIGNYIQIRSGTNVTAGFYRVTGHTDTNTVTLDRFPDDGVGGVSGGSGDLGGALNILTDAFLDDADTVVAGNTIYVKNDGTMTLAASISLAKDGTGSAYITVEGYNISRGDSPTGANRPTIVTGSNTLTFDNFWALKHLIVTTTSVDGLSVDSSARLTNVKVTNTSGSGGRDAIDIAALRCHAVRCEGVSTNGNAFLITSDVTLLAVYAHDSNVGIQIGSTDRSTILNSILDSNTTGINASGGAELNRVIGNTFYNNTTQILIGASSPHWIIYNNIFDAGTDGVKWGDVDATENLDHNAWNNTTDVTNVSKGPNAVTADPLLTDPANGDFTLQSGSPCLGAGIQMGVDQGVAGDYKVNIGADQDDVVAAGAASILGGGQLTGGFSS